MGKGRAAEKVKDIVRHLEVLPYITTVVYAYGKDTSIHRLTVSFVFGNDDPEAHELTLESTGRSLLKDEGSNKDLAQDIWNKCMKRLLQ